MAKQEFLYLNSRDELLRLDINTQVSDLDFEVEFIA